MNRRIQTALLVMLASTSAFAQGKKPDILVIMGDDIGWFNPSCYNSGVMGYRTPNIDRIAAEGARQTGEGWKLGVAGSKSTIAMKK